MLELEWVSSEKTQFEFEAATTPLRLRSTVTFCFGGFSVYVKCGPFNSAVVDIDCFAEEDIAITAASR